MGTHTITIHTGWFSVQPDLMTFLWDYIHTRVHWQTMYIAIPWHSWASACRWESGGASFSLPVCVGVQTNTYLEHSHQQTHLPWLGFFTVASCMSWDCATRRRYERSLPWHQRREIWALRSSLRARGWGSGYVKVYRDSENGPKTRRPAGYDTKEC